MYEIEGQAIMRYLVYKGNNFCREICCDRSWNGGGGGGGGGGREEVGGGGVREGEGADLNSTSWAFNQLFLFTYIFSCIVHIVYTVF